MPIKGLSEQKRLPRLGKLRLGIKVTNKKGTEYPKATNYFVCPDEVKKVYGEEPQSLDIIIPVEDEELWANQYYRQYSRGRGLVCKGDGEICRRMIDLGTGNDTNRDTKQIGWKDGVSCAGRACPDYQAKKCKEVMNLQFLLPRVPGLGIWQIDTGSINSIRNINNMAAMIRATCDRVSWIPLVLTLEPTVVTNPDDGKKKTVRCLNLRHEGSLGELLAASGKAKTELLITAPAEDEAPLDEPVETALIIRPDTKQAEKDTDLFPEDPPHTKAASEAAKEAAAQRKAESPGADEVEPDETQETPSPSEGEGSSLSDKTEEKEPTIKTIQALLNWVASHGKKYNLTWVKTTFSFDEKKMNTNPHECYLEIKELMGWD